jgi:hypothetical protein
VPAAIAAVTAASVIPAARRRTDMVVPQFE